MQLKVRTTTAIQSFLAACVADESRLDTATRAALQPYLHDTHVPYALLLEAWTSARASRRQPSTEELDAEGKELVPELTELLKGSEIVFPSFTTRQSSSETNESSQAEAKNPHLQSILASIRRDQEANEYERMTGFRIGDSDASEPVFRTSMDDPKVARRLLLTVINVFFTAASVFVAVMWIGPTVSDNVAWRVLVAFLLALLVLGGEAWLAYRSAFQQPMM